jgi:hypothetical protein
MNTVTVVTHKNKLGTRMLNNNSNFIVSLVAQAHHTTYKIVTALMTEAAN